MENARAALIRAGNVLSLVTYALVIAPVLRSGFIQDDRFDVLWGQLRHEYSLGALSDGVRWTDIYLHSLGRFHPIAHLVGTFSFEISDRETFKYLQFCLAIVIATVFMHLLNAWTGDRRTGPFSVLVLAALGQFRTDFDPIVSFGIHTKVLLLILLLQLVVIQKIANGSSHVGSLKIGLVVLLLSAAMYHEIAAVCSIGLIFIAGHLEAREASFVRRAVAWVLVAYVTLRFRMYLTTTSDIAMPYYQLSTDPLAVTIAFMKQLSGLVPILPVASWGVSILPSLHTLVLLTLLIGASLVLVGNTRFPMELSSLATTRYRRKSICLTFLWWIFGSASVVSLSAGHQMWSSWGRGYINIWVAQIGLSGLFGIAITASPHRTRVRRSIFSTGLMTVLLVLSSLTARVNSIIVDSNPNWEANTQINGWEREQALRAIEGGILNSISQSEMLVAAPPRPWMNESYLRIIGANPRLKLSNSWERFAEMPTSWPAGCSLRNQISTNGYRDLRENVVVCPDGAAKVMTSFADDFANGFSLLATLGRLSIALDQQTEQYRQNVTQTLVKNLTFFGSGKYTSCSSLIATSSSGKSIRLTLSGTSVKAEVERLADIYVRLNSILPTDC